jgi:hypothetical protein
MRFDSKIQVPLTEREMEIIQEWITYLRDVDLKRGWSEEENDLAERFNESQDLS